MKSSVVRDKDGQTKVAKEAMEDKQDILPRFLLEQ